MTTQITHSRVKLYATTTDYLELTRAALLIKDSQPAEFILDRLGREHVVAPTGTAARPLAVAARLLIRSADCYSMNSLADRNLVEWLRHHHRNSQTELYAYAYGRGTDSAHAAVHDQAWYKLRLREVPEWLNGLRTGLNGIERFQQFDFSVLDEGAFADWAQHYQYYYSLAIVAVSQANDTFSVAGDYRYLFTAAELAPLISFTVGASTGNNGTYTVESVAYDGGSDRTVVTVVEEIPHATADGSIARANLISRGGRS